MSAATNGVPERTPSPPPASPGLLAEDRRATARPSEPDRGAEGRIHPSLIETPEGNREIKLESVQDLIASIVEHGQLVELILYPHPDRPEHWVCADGNRRLMALRFLNREARARLLERAPTEAELIALRLTIDGNRKAMDKTEIGADIWRWMELTRATQDAAAQAFKFSTGYVSKLLAPFKRGIEPLIAMLEEGKISGTACALIAALPEDKQQQAIQDMNVIIAAHGKVKRDAAEHIYARLKGKPEKRPKPIAFASACGVSGTIKGPPLDTLKAFAAKLSEVIRRIEREPALVDSLPGLLK